LQELYEEFAPLQVEVVKNHCDVIPGVPEVVQRLRARGIKIANTTGFDTSMMHDLVKLASEGGYEPDLWVCPDQVGKGRPAPWMIHHADKALDVYPLSSFVKVGDTIADLQEAHNAGIWAVSVIQSGNEVGLSLPFVAVHTTVFERLIALTRNRGNMGFLMYVVDSVGYLAYVVVLFVPTCALIGEQTADHAFYQNFRWYCWIGLSVSSAACMLAMWYFATLKAEQRAIGAKG
jgi:phosphonoacetaldehyde hydrolase